MVEYNLIEALSKSKIAGVFLALWGISFIFMPLAYLTDFAVNGSSEPLLSIVFYIIADLAEIVAGIVLLVISIKILCSKS